MFENILYFKVTNWKENFTRETRAHEAQTNLKVWSDFLCNKLQPKKDVILSVIDILDYLHGNFTKIRLRETISV